MGPPRRHRYPAQELAGDFHRPGRDADSGHRGSGHGAPPGITERNSLDHRTEFTRGGPMTDARLAGRGWHGGLRPWDRSRKGGPGLATLLVGAGSAARTLMRLSLIH